MLSHLLHFEVLLQKQSSYLVNPAPDCVVEDAADQETLHVVGVDVELARDELDVDPGVGLDQLDQHLGADVAQQVLDVLPDEGVLHDGLPVLLKYFYCSFKYFYHSLKYFHLRYHSHLEYLLEVIDIIVLISVDQVGHGEDLHVILVGLGLLRVEGVDAGLHQHVGKD